MRSKEKVKLVEREPLGERLREKWNSPVFRKFRRNKLAIVGMIFVAGVFFTAIFADLIAPYHWNERLDLDGDGQYDKLHPPSRKTLLGTDSFGRDILSRIIHASRLDLLLGFILVSVQAAVGVPLGLIAGYYGGKVDALIMRAADASLAFPALLLGIALAAVVGGSLVTIVAALGAVGWAAYGRLVRGQVLAIKAQDFVEAARAFGEKDRSIMLRYIFPLTIAPVIVFMTTGLPAALLIGAALSFLGLGIQPPHVEWGLMLSDARGALVIAPVYATAVGLAIMITVLGFNFLGDGLRDALDPRLKY
jgi:ABC-type dipeptide/oligopeptide/nickel transport system permease subunit